MPLHQDMLALSRVVRPKILKLAREGRLVETCFQEFQEKVYPGAPDVQINAMRTSFFAGVAELFAMQIYASDTETDEPTDDDFALFSNIDDEVQRFHAQVIKATKATGKPS